MTSRTWRYTANDLSKLSPFGSVLAEKMPLAEYTAGKWSEPRIVQLADFQLHPGAHCLHYGSSCFEGLKAYRWPDDSLVIFRADQHAKRMAESAATLRLPVPDVDMLTQMMLDAVLAAADEVPPAPGSLYLRPVLIGVDTNIGAAATPSHSAYLYIIASPVGDYFAGGRRALRLLVEDKLPRTTPQFGRVKTGANYAAALGITLDAKKKWGIDQILFCPEGDVQETGASNFILIDEGVVVTKPLSDSFLHGITRDSVLTLAADLGYRVEQRNLSVAELLEWTKFGEAALSGTAAVLAGVGALIYDEQEFILSRNETGSNTAGLRKAEWVEIQQGVTQDSHGWITKVR